QARDFFAPQSREQFYGLVGFQFGDGFGGLRKLAADQSLEKAFTVVLRELAEDLSDVHGAEFYEEVKRVGQSAAANQPADRVQHQFLPLRLHPNRLRYVS